MIIMLAAVAMVAPDVPPAPPLNDPQLVEFDASPVTCGADVVAPTTMASPLPTGAFRNDWMKAQPRWTLKFRIDADGRPVSIDQADSTQPGVYMMTEDLAPALAAWRFRGGAPRGECTVVFTARMASVSQAPKEMLYRFMALPRLGGIGWAEARKRIAADSPNCFTPGYPKTLLQAYPDFDTIPEAAGGYSYTMTGFDIDKRGRPVRVRTIGSDGNAVLDRRGVAAITKSRFAAEARSGCHYAFYRRNNTPMPPPPGPERDSYVKPEFSCDNSVNFVRKPVMTFPEGFRRRAIEGWAVVKYDVAPWGATGNIEVLASEPAAAFGVAARQLISAATRPASKAGSTGCVDRIYFKLPRGKEQPNITDLPPTD